MNTTPSTTPENGGRALVLGGGGSTGNAWLIGVVAGLFEAGLDVTAADVTIGTSAGSTAAAQLAGATPTDLLAAVLTAVLPAASHQQRSGPVDADRQPDRQPVRQPVQARPGAVDHLERIKAVIASAENPADLRRRMGAAALARAASDRDAAASWQAQWRKTVAARLPGKHGQHGQHGQHEQHWPQRAVLITAVDARTGDPVIFDRHSGVDLVDAVAASCASGLPYRIGDGDYIDGGFRANAENADLAAGCGRVLVLSPFGGRSLHPVGWGTHLADQVDELRAHGSRVETVFPTAAPRTCSAPTRWTCRCARRPPEPATTRADPSPSGSRRSGTDPQHEAPVDQPAVAQVPEHVTHAGAAAGGDGRRHHVPQHGRPAGQATR